MKKQAESDPVSIISSKDFPIVAIGASAGGLEAINELFENLSPSTGMAFIYIQHLDPNYESKLSAILSRNTKMKVQEATDRMHIEPNQVFIIPPNQDMIIMDGVIKLDPRPPKPTAHLPVDKFFCSLAEVYKEASIGIVLSGNASDGTIGLKAIKMAGGITMAQDDSAKFKSMPKSAVAEGVVDLVLPPKEIAQQLERISKFSYKEVKHGGEESGKIDDTLQNIILLLKKSTSVDFSHYKMTTIRRRIERRMITFRLDDVKAYYQYLKKYPNEIPALYHDLLINVTAFFRDVEVFDYLKKTLVPNIFRNKTASETIRIWVPACSTGEEAYSLAIVIIEVMNDLGITIPVQIFATDLSESSIAKARLGLYSKNDLTEVSPERVQRFFTKIDGSYRVAKQVRDICVFAPHNIFKDPPFSRLDLISCCNLLIYLDSVLQKKVLATMHYALNKNGYLVLGRSETIGGSTQLFSQVDKVFRIYSRKNEGAAKAFFDMHHHMPEVNSGIFPDAKLPLQKPVVAGSDLDNIIDHILLNNYVPPSVVVNQDMDIVQFRGATRFFVDPSPGKASLNILKMIRSGLTLDLRNTFHKVNKTGEKIKKNGLQIDDNGILKTVSIEITPLNSINKEKYFLVVFEEFTPQVKGNDHNLITKDKQVKQLKGELDVLKEDMRSVVEAQEATVEELQSANEEVVSSNEELQSINEELETSKEELESTNEELMTINNELQLRNEQLAESYEYAEAMFDTIREAVLVLDKDFRVKTANKAFYKIFKTSEDQTEGMLLFELGNKQWNILQLREMLEQLIPNNKIISGFLVYHKFPEIGEKYMLLNARKVEQKIHQKDLIILAIEDITEHKQAQQIIADREQWLRNMANNAPASIWVADSYRSRNFFNKTWLEYTGTSLESQLNDGWQQVIHENDLAAYLDRYNNAFSAQKSFIMEYRVRTSDGSYRWMLEKTNPTFDVSGNFTGMIGTSTEIHDKRLNNEELERRVLKRTHELHESNKALERINSELEQYAYVASHDLQEPLRKISTYTNRLQEKYEGNGDQKKLVENILSSASKMSNLIDDILNFSKITTIDVEFIKVDLDKIFQEVISDFDVIIQQKKAVIKAAKLPVIEAIPLQARQLFHNLLSNSLKFSKEDIVPVIEITCETLFENSHKDFNSLIPGRKYIEIIFRDNGIGIEDGNSVTIFGMFKRLGEKHKTPGNGIGLALCKKILETHGGEINLLPSKENSGAAFQVILPVEQKVRKQG